MVLILCGRLLSENLDGHSTSSIFKWLIDSIIESVERLQALLVLLGWVRGVDRQWNSQSGELPMSISYQNTITKVLTAQLWTTRPLQQDLDISKVLSLAAVGMKTLSRQLSSELQNCSRNKIRYPWDKLSAATGPPIEHCRKLED